MLTTLIVTALVIVYGLIVILGHALVFSAAFSRDRAAAETQRGEQPVERAPRLRAV